MSRQGFKCLVMQLVLWTSWSRWSCWHFTGDKKRVTEGNHDKVFQDELHVKERRCFQAIYFDPFSFDDEKQCIKFKQQRGMCQRDSCLMMLMSQAMTQCQEQEEKGSHRLVHYKVVHSSMEEQFYSASFFFIFRSELIFLKLTFDKQSRQTVLTGFIHKTFTSTSFQPFDQRMLLFPD